MTAVVRRDGSTGLDVLVTGTSDSLTVDTDAHRDYLYEGYGFGAMDLSPIDEGVWNFTSPLPLLNRRWALENRINVNILDVGEVRGLSPRVNYAIVPMGAPFGLDIEGHNPVHIVNSVPMPMIMTHSGSAHDLWGILSRETPPVSAEPGFHTEESIRNLLTVAVANSANEKFRDGFDSDLSRGLKRLLRIGGETTVRLISSLVDSEESHSDVVGEILMVIGADDDKATHNSRLSLLLKCLKSSDYRVRDSASLGIASLDDPLALDELTRAVEREQIVELQQNLRLVLEQLRDTEWQIS